LAKTVKHHKIDCRHLDREYALNDSCQETTDQIVIHPSDVHHRQLFNR